MKISVVDSDYRRTGDDTPRAVVYKLYSGDERLSENVVQLSRATYEDRQIPAGTVDTVRLAVLGDALQDAGCDDDSILSHLRGPGPHVRGCWAVDLCLGLS